MTAELARDEELLLEQEVLHDGHLAHDTALLLRERDVVARHRLTTLAIADDPDHSRNDLDSMNTFSAAPPNHENIHPDWVDKPTHGVNM
jgi:hypothetical protein